MNNIELIKKYNDGGYASLKLTFIVLLTMQTVTIFTNMLIYLVTFGFVSILIYCCYRNELRRAKNTKFKKDLYLAETHLLEYCKENIKILKNKTIYLGENLYDCVSFTLIDVMFIKDTSKNPFAYSIEPGNTIINTINDLYD